MYYDLLTKLKNAQAARHEYVQVPFSKFDFAVARLLAEAGYVASVDKRAVGKKQMMEIKLRYRANGPAISDFKIISKPSRRFYAGYKELKPVKQNFGLGVLSTPSGIVTNRQARKQKVGGEYLFEVW